MGMAVRRRDRELTHRRHRPAAVLAAVGVVHVSDGVISPLYLLDAAAEGLLLAGWGVAAAEGVVEEGVERN